MAIFIIDDWACVEQASMPLSLGISGGWSNPLAEALIPLKPSEVIIGGWKNVDEALILLEPSEVIIGGWKRVHETTVNLLPPMACSTDDDCPEGYLCVGGVCIKKEAGFPWVWVAVGGAAVAAAVIVLGKKKEKKEPQKKK